MKNRDLIAMLSKMNMDEEVVIEVEDDRECSGCDHVANFCPCCGTRANPATESGSIDSVKRDNHNCRIVIS